MIFHIKVPQNLVAEQYDRDLEIIFLFKAAEKVVAESYERDFVMLFQFKRRKVLLQSTLREILK